MKRTLLSSQLLVLSTLSVLLIMTGCKPKPATDMVKKLPETTPVIVKQVSRISTNRIIEVSGVLTADRTSPVSFLVSGKVSRIFFDEGDHVEKGTVLATVDDTDYRNSLDIQEAALLRAKDAFDRYEPLFKEGAFSEQNFIELKTGLTQATAARNIAEKALADTELKSPINGIIGRKSVELGQMVSPQMPAFTIVKTDVVFARVSVPESEIGQVSLKQSANVTISALNGQTVSGRVVMVGAVADERTRTYPVKIELPNPDYRLKPGMIVRADIQTDTAVDILTIPGRAIVRDADDLTYVFIADAQTDLAQRVRVVPGQTFRNEIEIKSGLTPEDTVVISGQHKLTDGTPIVIEEEQNGKTLAGGTL